MIGLLCCLLMTACNNDSNNNNENNNSNSSDAMDEFLENTWLPQDIDKMREVLIPAITNQTIIDSDSESNILGITDFRQTMQNDSIFRVTYYSITLRSENGYTINMVADIPNGSVQPGEKYQITGMLTDELPEGESKTFKTATVEIGLLDDNGEYFSVGYDPQTDVLRVDGIEVDSLIGQPKNGI